MAPTLGKIISYRKKKSQLESQFSALIANLAIYRFCKLIQNQQINKLNKQYFLEFINTIF